MQTIPLSQEQFTRAQKALCADTDVRVRQDSPTAGTVDTSDVQFSYSFHDDSLDVEILRRKSIAARLAGDSHILDHIEALLKEA